MDFIDPCGANKSTFWPASRKKIVCNTGKTFILFVWLLPSFCSGIKLHTRKINFFFPSCTLYYCFPYNNKIQWFNQQKFCWFNSIFFWVYFRLATSSCNLSVIMISDTYLFHTIKGFLLYQITQIWIFIWYFYIVEKSRKLIMSRTQF